MEKEWLKLIETSSNKKDMYKVYIQTSSQSYPIFLKPQMQNLVLGERPQVWWWERDKVKKMTWLQGPHLNE